MSECENLDFRDPIEREIILENRRAEQQEMLEEKKKRNETDCKMGCFGHRDGRGKRDSPGVCR